MSLTDVNSKFIKFSDLSEGKSKYKIPVINEIDEENVEAQFLYVEKNVDDYIIKDKYKVGCSCKSICKEDNCECIKKSSIKLYKDGRIQNVKDLNGCFYDLVLFECSSSICSCNQNCTNRMTSEQFNLNVELFKTPNAGYAVRSRQYIKSGTFIAEFVGEILSYKEAEIRPKPEDYSFRVVNKLHKNEHFVDPTRYGNITRFFNHSCFENLLLFQFFSNHRDKKRASIGFVACYDILPGDELTIDYGTDWWLRNIRKTANFYCHCNWCYCIYPSPYKFQVTEEEAKKKAVMLIREKREKLLKYEIYK